MAMRKRQMGGRRGPPMRERREYESRVIEISRVTRVVAGGKRMRFRACVVVGNRKGKVGSGVAKGLDVPTAVGKATTAAEKQVREIRLAGETIPHRVLAKFRAAVVLLKPAPAGTGVKAGGPVRAVVELAGIKNIVSKMLGSQNKINNIQATLVALALLKEPRKSRTEPAPDQAVAAEKQP